MQKTLKILLSVAAILPLWCEVRPVPPPGVAVPAADRTELESGLARLGSSIDQLRKSGSDRAALVPDVEIYHKAVRFALQYNEFFKLEDIGRAKILLEEGQARADALRDRGEAPWTTVAGLVVRGYLSKIDHSVQPFGLVIPASYSPNAPHRWRVDAWFHGRQENLSEVNFLFDRERSPGEFTPRDTIVLHLYGRYCNANKLAGEVDLFEVLVAYSGETDIQKQAADVMAEALAHEGMRMTHIIGPGTAHRYHPQSKIEIDRLIDALASRGRDPYPRKIRFTTWTLAYNRMKWVTVDALNKHWDRARLDAEIADNYTVTVTSANVAAFSLDMGAGGCTLDLTRKPAVVIDGQHVAAQAPMSDRSWTGRFRNVNGRWTAIERLDEAGLEKRHGLQGPIDDAFLDSFIMVRPTGTAMAPEIARWV